MVLNVHGLFLVDLWLPVYPASGWLVTTYIPMVDLWLPVYPASGWLVTTYIPMVDAWQPVYPTSGLYVTTYPASSDDLNIELVMTYTPNFWLTCDDLYIYTQLPVDLWRPIHVQLPVDLWRIYDQLPVDLWRPISRTSGWLVTTYMPNVWLPCDDLHAESLADLWRPRPIPHFKLTCDGDL